ncbi:MAG: hypothetical protein P4L86_33060 [Mycobacterium sp.]|nr:hypothetical protein [Mycobacterium sp.]
MKEKAAPAGTGATFNATDQASATTTVSQPQPVAHFESLGEYYDDVIVTFCYDRRAVAVLKAMPRWARHFEAGAWHIHPGRAELVAACLRALGYTVIERRAA